MLDDGEGREEEDGRGLRAGLVLVVFVGDGDVGGGEFQFLNQLNQ